MLKLRARSSAGDTMIEVMIAIAIVSLVLTTAYAITNRSSNGLVDTHEHIQASRLASSQLEFLRGNGGLDDSDMCFDSNGAPTPGDDQACAFTADGENDCPTTNDHCYAVAVTKIDDTPTYKVHVTWDSLLGGTASVEMYYQMPPIVLDIPPSTPADPDSVGIGGYCSAHPAKCDGGGNGSGNNASQNTYAHYNFQGYINVLKIGTSPVVSCLWDWGDGKQSSSSFGSSSCKLGGTSTHTYPTLPGLPEGAKCTATTKGVKYTAVLYLVHADGSKTLSNSNALWRPNCF